jgi:hypothetical protein
MVSIITPDDFVYTCNKGQSHLSDKQQLVQQKIGDLRLILLIMRRAAFFLLGGGGRGKG